MAKYRLWNIESKDDRIQALKQHIDNADLIIKDLAKKRSKRKMRKNALILNELIQLQIIRKKRIQKIEGIPLSDLVDGVELSTYLKEGK